jgi:translation initiation factor 3 subunit D
MNLVARTRIDAAIQHSNPSPDVQSKFESSFPATETQFMTLKTLLEFDARVSNTPDWRQKLDTMKGAVLATEFKNNSVKLTRFTVESLLSGAEQMRLGFVSRTNPKDRRRHTVLGVGTFKPVDFIGQLNFNMGSGWGIVKMLTDFCFSKLEDGKYFLVKDPNKAVLRLYSVPMMMDDGETADQ